MNSLSMGATSCARFNETSPALCGVEVDFESSNPLGIKFKWLKDQILGGIMSRNIIMAICTLIVALAMSQVAAAQGIPVIPGAVGFGITTPAGRGGQIYRVTNLNNSGTGSLRACIEASGPRTCIFEVSGAIWLTPPLKLNTPNITIAGQTAPSPGIELRNAALLVVASDVLIQHIRIRVGDDPSGTPYENRDALQIEGPGGRLTQNVVVDHSSFSWATDETATLYSLWDNITLSNNIFSDALHDSMHPDTAPPGKRGGGIVRAC